MELWEEEYSVSTAIVRDIPKKFSFEWVIPLSDISDRNVSSMVRESSNSNHLLTIYPNGIRELGGRDFVALVFESTVETSIAEEVGVEFYILDSAMELRNKRKAVSYLIDKSYVCATFVRRDKLSDSNQRLLNDNNLTIVCRSANYDLAENIPSDIDIEFQKCKHKVNLSSDLEKIWQNKLYTDVTLMASDKKLHAHKLVLIARSPVFAAMLQNDMKEKIKSEIQIQDYNADVLSEMLQFMYTGRITNIKKHFQDLLYLANKYDIEGLKHICEEFMFSGLGIDNVIEVFLLADSQNCNRLKPKVLTFVLKNASAIIQSPQFESRKKDLPPLFIDMLKAVVQ